MEPSSFSHKHAHSPHAVGGGGSPPDAALTDVEHEGYCFPQCPDEFVVGYGLDYDGDLRSLPYVRSQPPPAIVFELRFCHPRRLFL